MQVIPTRVHGMIDYAVGVVLILAPFLFGFADGSAAQWVPTIIGLLVILTSLVTAYELSLARLVPMPVHLWLDVLLGLLLLLSPWLFGFAERIWWPHVLVGLLSIIVPLLTDRTSRFGPEA